MKTIIKKEKSVIKTSIVLFLFLSFIPVSAFTEDTNNIDINNSMYKYGAIENTISYFEMIKNNENLNPKIFINEELVIDDSIKKLENLIERHNFSTKKINESMDSINEKSKLKSFMTGNDLGILKFQLVQINYEIQLLDDLNLNIDDNENKIRIEKQLELLKNEKSKVEKFILNQENEFSLLGWFVVML